MLSKTALHALRAMIALAEKPDEFQGAAALAEHVGAPPNYLGKLLQNLAAWGLVTSQRGLGGGFRLQRPSNEITVFEVVEPIDQVSRWSGCFLKSQPCSETDPCPLHQQYATVRSSYMKILKETRLSEIAAGQGRLFEHF